MMQRYLYLLKTYLLTVLFLVIAKIGFMWYNAAGHDFSSSDITAVLWHGLTLDLSTALYILIIPFLAVVASIFLGTPKWLRVLLTSYFAVIALALALAFVADTCLYAFWQFKLDASCLQYLETPTEAMASVSAGWLLLRALAILLLAALFFVCYTRPRCNMTASRHPVLESLAALACIPFIVIGIRGGLDESTTNIGQVYYSQNQFLNHAAVNPVFSFLSSFEKTASNIVDYSFYGDDECRQLTDGLYPTDSVATDTLLNTTRPDVLVILMESAGEVVAPYMPCLQQLKREGISFDSCYANSWRTDRGTVCTYSGYPSFPTSSVMKMPIKTHLLPGLAATLQREGYATHYLYGGDINFTNMRSYLIAGGFQELTWKDDYTIEEQGTSKWGVRDDITFNTLMHLATTMQSPWLIGFSTLSSHEPWDAPVRQYDDAVANSFYYLDQCLSHFIAQLKKTPRWDSLLVVILPDHSIDYGPYTEMDKERNRIPMVWVGGAVRQPRRITAYCNQTDLVATLLAQMHLPHRQFRWSRDVLSSTYRYPFAVHNFNNGFSVIDSTGFVVYDLDSRRIMVDESSDASRLERMGKAILQATTADLKAIGTNN